MTTTRLTALVPLGTVTIDDRTIAMTWLAAGGTDTVMVDCPDTEPHRIGTVVALGTGHPRLVPQPGHEDWLAADHHRERLIAQALAAYRTPRQAS